jgi:iron uptake system EfeUOB component EfeO/EfeM
MRKLAAIFLSLTLASVFVLAGCGANNKVQDGTNKMLDTTAQLSKAIDSGDQAKLKETGPKLEEQWSSFEDEVKKENKPLYDKIEKYLDPTIAGTEAATLDKQALSSLNNNLTAALKELAAKTK